MTLVAENLADPIQSCPKIELDSLRMLANPNDQLKVLSSQFNEVVGHIPYRIVKPEEEAFYAPLAQELVDFAANPDSTHSLAVKVFALEKALTLGYGSEFCDLRNGSEDGYLACSVLYSYSNFNFKEERQTQEWRYLFRKLMDDEGIDDTFFWPEADKDWIEHETFTDNHPSMALIFLNKVIEANYKTDPSEVPVPVIDMFTPLAQGLQDVMTRTLGLPNLDVLQPINSWRTIYNLLGLSEYSKNTRQEIISFFNHRDVLSREHYDVIHDLADGGEELSWQFPEEYETGVTEGFRHLMADSIYALLAHQKNNERSHAQLPLKNSNSELSLTLVGDEPLQLLKALAQACEDIIESRKWGYYIRNDFFTIPSETWRSPTVSAIDQPQFKIFRLIGANGQMNTSVYIRPRGGEQYDAQLEYGRNGEGVEASISYVVDPFLPKGTLVELGKHRGTDPDNRISIRLDREGVSPEQRHMAGVQRDPTQEVGTVSLDVGSVIGNEDWLGTRIGRFLAWGNLLRTTAHGDVSQLNHMTTYFNREHGTATHFAEAAEMLIEAHRKRSLAQEEISRMMPALLSDELGRW